LKDTDDIRNENSIVKHIVLDIQY